MAFDIPLNILFMIGVFTVMDVFNEIQRLTFTTLADQMKEMNNHTLIAHYGIEPTETSISMMNSVISMTGTLGVFLSIIFVIPTADRRGRKYSCVSLRTIFSCAASICQMGSAFLQSTELYILGNLIGGICILARTYLTTLYVTECSPDKYRGFATAAFVFSDVIAQLFMFSVASPSVLGRSNTWFIFPLIALVGSIMMYFVALRFHESPKWLVKERRLEEARQSVRYFQGSDVDIDEVMISLIRENNLTAEDSISLKEIWDDETMRQALKLKFVVSIFLTFNPIMLEMIYNLQINQIVGFTTAEALNINSILVLLFFPAKFIGTYIIDALGRRPVLFIATTIMYFKNCAMLVALWFAYLAGPNILSKSLLISSECLSELYSASGVAALDFLCITELFPPSARTTVAQSISLLNMVAHLPLNTLYPVMNTVFPPGNYFVYLVLPPILIVYLYKYLPETKGRAICDIIESFDEEVMTRHATMIEEKTPLIRKRSNTHACKRNSILNTPRTRALTFDHQLIPTKLAYQ